MGIIVELYKGRDDVIRVAKLCTSRGYPTKPIVKLYPLELSVDSSGDLINIQPERAVQNREG